MTDALSTPLAADPTTPPPTDPNMSPNTSTTDSTPKDTPPSSLASDKPTDEPKPSDKPAVPEKYEFKAPDGFELNADRVAKAEELFREFGLSNDQAQKLVDMVIAQEQDAANEPFKAYEDMRKGWRDEVIADKTLGNGTDNLKDEVRAAIGRVKDAMGAELRPAFEEAMTITGAGDHPAFIRAMFALSKVLTEGRPATGNPAAPRAPAPSAAQAIYPNLPSASQPQRG